MNIKRKIKFTIVVIIVLAIIGVGAYFLKRYLNSEQARINRYQKETQDILKLNNSEKIIKALKSDLNSDGNMDYLFLTGVSNVVGQKNSVQTDNTTIKTYSNVSLVYIDGGENSISKIETDKSFESSLKFDIQENENEHYIFVYDQNNGNLIFADLKNNELKDIVANSQIKELLGYTFTTKWKEGETAKLGITLDNYGREYLNEKKDEYVLDFSNTEVNKENYRESYLANKFCSFDMLDIDDDGNIEFVGIQNLLYLNKDIETVMKTAGTIKVIFNVEDSKFVYKDVKVEI